MFPSTGPAECERLLTASHAPIDSPDARSSEDRSASDAFTLCIESRSDFRAITSAMLAFSASVLLEWSMFFNLPWLRDKPCPFGIAPCCPLALPFQAGTGCGGVGGGSTRELVAVECLGSTFTGFGGGGGGATESCLACTFTGIGGGGGGWAAGMCAGSAAAESCLGPTFPGIGGVGGFAAESFLGSTFTGIGGVGCSAAESCLGSTFMGIGGVGCCAAESCSGSTLMGIGVGCSAAESSPASTFMGIGGGGAFAAESWLGSLLTGFGAGTGGGNGSSNGNAYETRLGALGGLTKGNFFLSGTGSSAELDVLLAAVCLGGGGGSAAGVWRGCAFTTFGAGGGGTDRSG